MRALGLALAVDEVAAVFGPVGEVTINLMPDAWVELAGAVTVRLGRLGEALAAAGAGKVFKSKNSFVGETGGSAAAGDVGPATTSCFLACRFLRKYSNHDNVRGPQSPEENLRRGDGLGGVVLRGSTDTTPHSLESGDA